MFTGQSAFYLQGESEITTAEAVEGLKFGMVPVPTLFDQPATQGDSHSFVLRRNDRQTPEQLQRAMTFVKSLLDQSLTSAKGGHVPAYLPTLNSPSARRSSPSPTTPTAVSSVPTTPRRGTRAPAPTREHDGRPDRPGPAGPVVPAGPLAAARAQLAALRAHGEPAVIPGRRTRTVHAAPAPAGGPP